MSVWEAGHARLPTPMLHLTTSLSTTIGVILAKAGIHFSPRASGEMDPRFRGDDVVGVAEVVAGLGVGSEGTH